MPSPKKYKLVKEVHDHYEVMHPDGSSFKVAKQGLGKKTHEFIKALPYQEPQHLAEGGEAKGIQYSDMNPPQQDDYSQALQGMTITPQPAPMSSQPEDIAQTTRRIIDTPEPQRAPQSQPSATAQKQEAAGPPSPDFDTRSADAFAMQKQAAELEAKGKTSTAAQMQTVLGQAQKEMQDSVAQKAIFDKRQAEIDASEKAYRENPIQVNGAFHDPSALNRIGTALTLILGGIGQGAMRSSTNPVMDMINRETDQDIAKQKANKEAEGNLYRLNLNRFNDERSADIASRNQRLSALKIQMEGIAQSGIAPKAQAEMLRQTADITKQQINNEWELSKRQMLMGNDPFAPPGSQRANVGVAHPEMLDPKDTARMVPLPRDPNAPPNAPVRYLPAGDEKTAQDAKKELRHLDEIEQSVKGINSEIPQGNVNAMGALGAIPVASRVFDAEVHARHLRSAAALPLQELFTDSDGKFNENAFNEYKSLIPDVNGTRPDREREKGNMLLQKIDQRRQALYRNIVGFEPTGFKRGTK